MKTTKEKIEVMQAYVDGKDVEYYAGSGIGWCLLCEINPKWDWVECDYRIKPETKEPTYRPYESVEEMVEDFLHRFQNLSTERDSYNDDFVYDRIGIDYCPFCGRKLVE